MSYLEEVFYPASLNAAKDTVLSPTAGDPDKFERETTFLVSFIKTQGLVSKETRVLDFGCGMGRVAKALIDSAGCVVVGTDISHAMRRFAKEYVSDARFSVEEFPTDTKFDVALVAFVLQHVQFPDIEVERLQEAVRLGGILVLLDEHKRLVPNGLDAEGYVVWSDDGININTLLERYFEYLGNYPYAGRTDTPLSLWRKR